MSAVLCCAPHLQDTGLMAQLQRVKAVFSEPRQAGDAFDTAIRRYYEAVDEGGGGIFMAVCRGKVGRRSYATALEQNVCHATMF